MRSADFAVSRGNVEISGRVNTGLGQGSSGVKTTRDFLGRGRLKLHPFAVRPPVKGAGQGEGFLFCAVWVLFR